MATHPHIGSTLWILNKIQIISEKKYIFICLDIYFLILMFIFQKIRIFAQILSQINFELQI